MIKVETKSTYFFNEDKLKKMYEDYIEWCGEDISFEEWIKFYAKEEDANFFWDCIIENTTIEKITFNVDPFK